MHGYSRLGNSTTATANGRSVTVSTTPSPPSSPRFRHGRSKLAASNVSVIRLSKQQSMVERVMVLIISIVFRRKGVLLLAPLLYIVGMLLYIGGSLNLDVNVINNIVLLHHHPPPPPPPGSLYRSPQLFNNLWPFMESHTSSNTNGSSYSNNVISWDKFSRELGEEHWALYLPKRVILMIDLERRNQEFLMTAWDPKLRQHWKPCSNNSISEAGLEELPKSNGFLIIEANGGLNQQRLSICDAVAVAGLLNATLVVPIFHLNSVWRDSSKFGDIFDEDFFINALRNNVTIVRELPENILQRYDNNISSIVNLRVKGWSSPKYYLQKVVPKLVEMGAVRIAPFSNRLALDVPSEIQRLRCFSNYEAMRFSEPIRTLAEKMVERMIKQSSDSEGKYVSVHLRFEMDMVAFSCCEYDGGEEEKHEMDMARERGWRGKFRRRGRVIRPGANRIDGKCPLTPLEVGMMLRGMGFDNSTSLFVAAGNIYKAEKYMAPLKQMFPRLETKETLATPEELAIFKGHSSRLAALDYTVCLHSEVFVTTQGGNFPHFLMGHRHYLYQGHAKTIKPDKRKWEDFQHQMREMLHHSDVKGSELKKANGSLYTFPMPDCMCKHPEASGEDNNNTTGKI
ncbi:hypothetical protein ACFE04_007214 [Oxalis oulophora]